MLLQYVMLCAVGDRFSAVDEDDREEKDGLSKQALQRETNDIELFREKWSELPGATNPQVSSTLSRIGRVTVLKSKTRSSCSAFDKPAWNQMMHIFKGSLEWSHEGWSGRELTPLSSAIFGYAMEFLPGIDESTCPSELGLS